MRSCGRLDEASRGNVACVVNRRDVSWTSSLKLSHEGDYLTPFVFFRLHSRPAGSSVENPVKGDRTYLIGGNWKCNGTLADNAALIKTFNEAGPIPSNVEVAICSTYIHLPQLLDSLRDDIAVGAQNCGNNTKGGAFTGEIGAFQLKDLGCVWVIIGHSERREGFGMAGEPEELCAEKAKVALDAGLKVMFAIGEKKEQREAGTTMDVCAKQLEPLAKVLEAKDWENVAIAYEPVWAVSFLWLSFCSSSVFQILIPLSLICSY